MINYKLWYGLLFNIFPKVYIIFRFLMREGIIIMIMVNIIMMMPKIMYMKNFFMYVKNFFMYMKKFFIMMKKKIMYMKIAIIIIMQTIFKTSKS